MIYRQYLNRKTDIVGEVQSGKANLTQKILRGLMPLGNGPIAILDLAPERTYGVGGKLVVPTDLSQKISYFSPLVIPSRLTAQSEEETWQIV